MTRKDAFRVSTGGGPTQARVHPDAAQRHPAMEPGRWYPVLQGGAGRAYEVWLDLADGGEPYLVSTSDLELGSA